MPAPTFRSCIDRSLTKAALLALVAAAMLVPASMGPSNRDAPDTSDLLISSACWTGGDGHPTATKVVVEVDGQLVLRGGRTVAQAIEQTQYGVDHGLHVAEFCA